MAPFCRFQNYRARAAFLRNILAADLRTPQFALCGPPLPRPGLLASAAASLPSGPLPKPLLPRGSGAGPGAGGSGAANARVAAGMRGSGWKRTTRDRQDRLGWRKVEAKRPWLARSGKIWLASRLSISLARWSGLLTLPPPATMKSQARLRTWQEPPLQ